jgi:hypothetical protein
MVIRECAKDSASLLTLTAGSGITLGADGTIEIEMTATQAANLTAGDNVYEIELSQGYLVIAFATGKAKVYEEIARTPLPPTTFNAVIVSGAGSEEANGVFALSGTNEGKGIWGDLSGVYVWWEDGQWKVQSSGEGVLYQSSDDTEFPWEATYEANNGLEPVPTLTPTNV